MSLCECEESRRIEQLGYWDGCPLEGGGHTSFAVEKCSECGGICGFPQSNFELALKTGTPAAKEKLAEIIN